jgi:hypothetical protein
MKFGEIEKKVNQIYFKETIKLNKFFSEKEEENPVKVATDMKASIE